SSAAKDSSAVLIIVSNLDISSCSLDIDISSFPKWMMDFCLQAHLNRNNSPCEMLLSHYLCTKRINMCYHNRTDKVMDCYEVIG
ncbi:MAG: hypothetical protein II470_10760, partial [Selenomonas sp.]|nr:hypothetical protein [Selenomonas sp.]